MTAFAAVGAAFVLGAAPTFAAPFQGKPDTIFRLHPRTGEPQSIVGTVTSDELDEITISMRGDKEQKFDSLQVIEVIWGASPASFTDGLTYSKRGDWENAVESFQSAAGDSDARGPIRAAARFHAVEALIEWGAKDRARFADAISEADRFLADHSTNRRMPEVRALKARAAWLAGDAAAARDGYKALFDAGKGAAGYAPMLLADAALSAGRAAIDADDHNAAKGYFESARAAYAAIEGATPRQTADAAAGVEIASLGDAMAQVAKGEFVNAKRGFERGLQANETAAGKSEARLGLARVLLGEGKAREAQLEFGWVAGLDHTSRDRRAEALVGLAEAAKATGTPAGNTAAKDALERVMRELGTTPAATRAAELLETM